MKGRQLISSPANLLLQADESAWLGVRNLDTCMKYNAKHNLIVIHDETGTVAKAHNFAHILAVLRSDDVERVCVELAILREIFNFRGTLKWSQLSDNSRSRGARPFARGVFDWYFSSGFKKLGLAVIDFDRSCPFWNDSLYGNSEQNVYNATLRRCVNWALRSMPTAKIVGDDKRVLMLSDDRGRVESDNIADYLPARCADFSVNGSTCFVDSVRLVDGDGARTIPVGNADLRDIFAVADFLGGMSRACLLGNAPLAECKRSLIRDLSRQIHNASCKRVGQIGDLTANFKVMRFDASQRRLVAPTFLPHL